MDTVPEYNMMKKMAEERLSKRLEKTVFVKLVKGYHEGTLEIIKRIDHNKFRDELQYSGLEIEERMRKTGFLCFLIYVEDEPVAFEYGYDVSDGIYFSDSQASLIEGKGIGSTQFALEILYLYYKGYKKVLLTTEEMDDQGRALRGFWERLGFVKTNEDKNGNVEMELDLNKESAQYLYQRYILPRD